MRVSTPGIRAVCPTATFNDKSRVGIVLKSLDPDGPDGCAMYSGNLVNVLMLDTLMILHDVIVANSSGDTSCPTPMIDVSEENYNAVMGAIEGTGDLPDLNSLAGDRVIVEFMNGGIPYVCNTLINPRPNPHTVPKSEAAEAAKAAEVAPTGPVTGTVPAVGTAPASGGTEVKPKSMPSMVPAYASMATTLVKKMAQAAPSSGDDPSDVAKNDARDINNYVASFDKELLKDYVPPDAGLDIPVETWRLDFEDGWKEGLMNAWDAATTTPPGDAETVEGYRTRTMEDHETDASNAGVAARVAGYGKGLRRARILLSNRRMTTVKFAEQMTSAVAYLYAQKLRAGQITPEDDVFRAARGRMVRLLAGEGGRPTRNDLGSAFGYIGAGHPNGPYEFIPTPSNWTRNLEAISFLYNPSGADSAEFTIATTVHRKVAPMVICAFAEIEYAQRTHGEWLPKGANGATAILTLPGWMPRYARRLNSGQIQYKTPMWSATCPGGVLSPAAFGAAIFVDADLNGFGSPANGTIWPWVVDIFKSWGFTWGGDWQGDKRDPRLFEWSRPATPQTDACLQDGDE